MMSKAFAVCSLGILLAAAVARAQPEETPPAGEPAALAEAVTDDIATWIAQP